MGKNEELPIFSEILSNVKSITTLFGLPNASSAFTLQIHPLKLIISEGESSSFNRTKTASPSTTSRTATIQFSQTIETSEQPSITPSNDSLDLKLKLRSYARKKPAKQAKTIDVMPPLSASELKNLKNILCGCCNAQFNNLDNEKENDEKSVDGGGFIKIMDMPSEHWLELVDCWMCHQEDYKQAQLGEIIAKERFCLVGNTYFLLHPTDIKKDLIKLVDCTKEIDWSKGLSKRWRPICCSRCLSPIGEGLYYNPNNLKDEEISETLSIPTLMAVRFSKYMTTIEFINTGKELTRKQYPFASFVAFDLLESVKAHATYRFIIKGIESSQLYLLVWVFDWDTKIITNTLTNFKIWKKFPTKLSNECNNLFNQDNNDLEKIRNGKQKFYSNRNWEKQAKYCSSSIEKMDQNQIKDINDNSSTFSKSPSSPS
ncbi:10330_t:CDS:2, partial [Entrophospora sp. SA101]